MDVKNTPSYLYWLFCQFELITCSYLMEPWEKVLFYSFNLAMLGLLLYTTYICLAFHASSLKINPLKYKNTMSPFSLTPYSLLFTFHTLPV
uniref:Serine palmitoyltransferase small subunit B n=1 Tax=Taeniopygia guttata TaxID=59729 RepID=H0ZLL9_TAEGU